MSKSFDLVQMLLDTYEAAKTAEDIGARVKVVELLYKMSPDGKTVKQGADQSDLDQVLQARNTKRP